MLEKVARSRCITLWGGTPNQRQISSTWCWRVSMNCCRSGIGGELGRLHTGVEDQRCACRAGPCRAGQFGAQGHRRPGQPLRASRRSSTGSCPRRSRSSRTLPSPAPSRSTGPHIRSRHSRRPVAEAADVEHVRRDASIVLPPLFQTSYSSSPLGARRTQTRSGWIGHKRVGQAAIVALDLGIGVAAQERLPSMAWRHENDPKSGTAACSEANRPDACDAINGAAVRLDHDMPRQLSDDLGQITGRTPTP
jgi:hypothetical protein